VPLVVEHRDLPADDPKQRQPDISRARALLKWEPKVPLDQGLDRTIAYFRDLLANGTAEDEASRMEAVRNGLFPA
jgi:nucleoside-diphosphate-sugar epimerase